MPYTFNRFQTGRESPEPLHTTLMDLDAVCEHSGQRLEPTCVYWLEGNVPHMADPGAFDPERIEDIELRTRLTEDCAMHNALCRAQDCLRNEAQDLSARIEASLQPALRPYPGSPDSSYRREWDYQARQLLELYVFEATLAWGCWQCETCYAAAGVLVRQLGVLRLRDLVLGHESEFSTAMTRLAVLLRDAGYFEETRRLLDKSWDILFAKYGRTGIESSPSVNQFMDIYLVMRLLPPAEVMDINGIDFTIRPESSPLEKPPETPAEHTADHLRCANRRYGRGGFGMQ